MGSVIVGVVASSSRTVVKRGCKREGPEERKGMVGHRMESGEEKQQQ